VLVAFAPALVLPPVLLFILVILVLLALVLLGGSLVLRSLCGLSRALSNDGRFLLTLEVGAMVLRQTALHLLCGEVVPVGVSMFIAPCLAVGLEDCTALLALVDVVFGDAPLCDGTLAQPAMVSVSSDCLLRAREKRHFWSNIC